MVVMNKIVREHYPASKLRDDLRSIAPAGGSVRVTVESKDAPPMKPIRQIMAEVDKARATAEWKTTTIEGGAAQVRELRDEWDD
jgi:hypothetical protein